MNKGTFRLLLVLCFLLLPLRSTYAATTIFSDNFNSGVGTLASHTPSTTGTGWTLLIDNGMTLNVSMSTPGYVSVTSNATDAGSFYTAEGTYPSADYEISADAIFAAGASNYPRSLGLRVQDSNNMYLLRTTNSTMTIYKRVSGTWTSLNSGSISLTDNITSPYYIATLTFSVIGNTLTGKVNGVAKVTTTDSSITATGKAGIGLGYVAVSTDDGGTGVEMDNVLVQTASIDSTAPSVSLLAPTSSEATSSVMTLVASSSDDVAVAGVTFYVDNIKQGSEDTSAPYSISYNTTGTTTGSHTAFAVARDSSNNYATSSTVSFTVDNTPPSVSLVAPTASEATSSSVTLSATASDANSSVAGVSFYVDGVRQGSEDTSSPYTISWDSTATSSGTHLALAVARDTLGNRATSTAVSFTVSNSGSSPTSVSASANTAGATITWSTASAASSRIFFGPTTAYGSSTPESNTSPRVTSHSVQILGLPSCTTYHYVAVGRNSVLDTATSSDATFSTTGCTGSASITATGANTITTASGGTLTQGNLTLSVPVSFTATSSSAIFQANQIDGASFNTTAGAPSGVSAAGSTVFHLVALTDATTTLSTFTAALTITLSYSAGDVSGIDESTLKIYRYDGASWNMLSNCSVNTSAKTVTCNTDHFSDFALFGTASAQNNTSNSASAGSGALPWCSGPFAPGWNVALPDGGCSTGTLPYTEAAAALSEPVAKAHNVFVRTLRVGSTGNDVRSLQQFLNAQGFILASRGSGSPGEETDYFGLITYAALIKFQEAHADKILTPLDLTHGTGIFGPSTMSFVQTSFASL